MPYIIDPKTGKKIEIDPITGQPVEQATSGGMDASSPGIFKQEQKVTTPEQKTQKNIQEYEEGRSGFQKFADFFLPRGSKLMRKLGGSINLRKDLDQADKIYADFKAESDRYAEMAKKETDPKKRKELFDLGMQALEAGEKAYENAKSQYEKTSGVSFEEETDIFRESLGVAGEVGSYLIPADELAKGASLVQKIIAGGKLGAKTGLLLGVTSPEDLTLEERAVETLKQGGTGLVIGGLMSGAWEVTRGAAKKILGGSKNRIAKIFRISPSKRVKFQKVTGGLDFDEEILTRDGAAIAGMDYDQLVEHFGKRKAEAIAAKNALIKGSDKTVSKKVIVDAIDSQLADLTPEKGFLETTSAGLKSTLEGIRKNLETMPDDLPAPVADKIKSQLQEEGSKAYTAAGSKSNTASSAYDYVGRVVKEAIEEAHKPGADIGISAFRGEPVSTVADTLPYFDTPRSKGFENALNNTVDNFNLQSSGAERAAGIWEGTLEPSFYIDDIKYNSVDELLSYAAQHGQKANQDAVGIFLEGAGDGTKYIFENIADGDEAIRIMQQNGVPGASLVDDKLIVLDADNSLKDGIMAVGEILNAKPKQTTGQIEFIEREAYEALIKEGSGKGINNVYAELQAQNPVKEANQLIQLYSLAEESISQSSAREVNKLSNDVAQKFFQVLPTMFSGAGAFAGYQAAGPAGGFGGFILSQMMLGTLGAARIKYFSPQVQTRLAHTFSSILKNQGVQNADKAATRIVQEMARVAAIRNAAQRTEQPDQVVSTQPEQGGQTIQQDTTQPGQEKYQEEVGHTPIIPGMTPDNIATNRMVDQGMLPEEQREMYPQEGGMITIKNTKTGEVKQVRQEELNQYGISGGPGTQPGVPTKDDILVAMAMDFENTGGKNISKLYTMFNVMDKMEKAGEVKLSAAERAKVAEAQNGLNLVDTLETSFSEIQDLGLAAEKGGLVERAKGFIAGTSAAITQEGTEGAAAASYENTKQAFLSRLARATGEKGVLTDTDLARIEKALPKFSDSPETVKRQFALIRQIIGGAIQTKMGYPIGEEVPATTGTNFAGGESAF